MVNVTALTDGRAENVKLLRRNVLIQAVMVMEDVGKVFVCVLQDGQEKVVKQVSWSDFLNLCDRRRIFVLIIIFTYKMLNKFELSKHRYITETKWSMRHISNSKFFAISTVKNFQKVLCALNFVGDVQMLQ